MKTSQSRKEVAAAVLLLAWTPLLAHAVQGNFAFFANRDSGGGALYGGAPVQLGDADACQSVCIADPTCYGWTLSRGEVGAETGFCYLKGEKQCDANALSQERPPGLITSAIIGDTCTVLCEGVGGVDVAVTVGPADCEVITPEAVPTGAFNRYRRDMQVRKAQALKKKLCPEGSSACQIHARSTGYECLNLDEELESCGACGNDCTQLPGINSVSCSEGKCMVHSCAYEFELDHSTGTCREVAYS